MYADHAEGNISKLQHEYLEKYYPRQHTHSTEVVPNERIGGKVSTTLWGWRENVRNLEPAVSEEGIADITHGFQLSLFDVTSKLEFDNTCRRAVTHLNYYRLSRVEDLRDGYDVSNILSYDIDRY